MAITRTTIAINNGNVGWAKSDVISGYEQAFSWAGMHNLGIHTGLAVGIGTTTRICGGTLADNTDRYFMNVPCTTVTGFGTGATFDIRRYDSIRSIRVNNPGKNYSPGDIIKISASDTGGATATDVFVPIVVDSQVLSGNVGYAVSFDVIDGTSQGYPQTTISAIGTDRNGAVSGINTTITIIEGDTLNLIANTGDGNYGLNIIWKEHPDNVNYCEDNNRVFNVANQNTLNITWTPLPGQAGIYRIVDDPNVNWRSETKIVVLPASSENIGIKSYGSSTQFYSKNLSTTYSYGTLANTVQSGKKYGVTYRTILTRPDNNNLTFSVGNGFHPTKQLQNTTGYYIQSNGHGYPEHYCGEPGLETRPFGYNAWQTYSPSYISDTQNEGNMILSMGSNTSYRLDLNVFKSGIDPNFVVFSLRNPTISSLKINDNTFSTFFFHNFTTSLWDLDYVFLAGSTYLVPGYGANGIPFIDFRTVVSGNYYLPNGIYGYAKRCAETGYIQNNSNQYARDSLTSRYVSTTYSSVNSGDTDGRDNHMYYRSLANSPLRNTGYFGGTVSADANFNAVINGIPLCTSMVPCPYYLPDDFVLINFDYSIPSTNIQQLDTITVNENEVYTIIDGSYMQSPRTQGILFCARIL